MSNTFLLKKSSVASKVPLTTDLAYGEIALNYADGKLYYKTSGNTIDSIPSVSATATLTNKTLTSPTINGGALSGTFSGVLTLSDTTASTSTSTGAVKIAGGLGVAGSIYADQIRLTNNGNGTNVYIGDDVVIGDVNAANTLGIRGIQDSTQGYIVFGSSNNTAYIGRSGTNPITVYGGQLTVSGTATGSSAIMLQLNGYTNKGGVGYHDFLSTTNTYASATNPNKFFRLDSSGSLQIINSAYTANIFNLTDAGVLSVPQISASNGVGSSGQVLSSTGTGLQWVTVSGTGTVTSVTAGTGLTGGTFTTSGTIAIDTTVVATLTGSQTLTNKTLTSPVISSISNTGTLTLPTSTDTLVGRATTDTLSNKSLNAFDQKTGSTSIANQSVWQSVTTTTAQIAIDSFAAATYRSAKYVVQLTQGTNYQVSEIMIIHNGTTTTMTEYGMMNTNGVLGTFATDISAGYVRLLVTMGSATSVTINMVRTTIVV